MNDILNHIRYGMNPVLFCKECLQITLDAWQEQVLTTDKSRVILLCSRQAGKSTVSAIAALHVGLFRPNSLILLVSPSERQSKELLTKIKNFYDMLPGLPALEENNKLSMELYNGSRIVALPGTHATIRGYSGPQLIIEDESAQCPDSLFSGITPMLATSQGQLMLLSTAYGRNGHFFEIFTGDDQTWERIKIPADQCPRISKEFLEEQKLILTDWEFRTEFCCEWGNEHDSIFSYETIMNAMSSDIEPLFQQTPIPGRLPGLSQVPALFQGGT